MKIVDKTKQTKIILALVIGLLVITVMSWFFYQNRCHFITCRYASWETIQSIAFAKANNATRIDSFTARSSQWNSNAGLESAVVEIDVYYVSKVSKETGNIEMYRLDSIKIDDKTLVTYPEALDMLISDFPSLESQEILKRVKIQPREAFAAYSKLAQSEPLLSLQNLNVWANLIILDNGKAFDGHESVWHIYYGDKLTYSVDAQTGEVFSVERWP
jgi:hypothetical protein